MKKTNEYNSIFAGARLYLLEELNKASNSMSCGVENGHEHSWLYITSVADDLTAYNELSPLSFFVKLRNFL